jgi:hypothetical protein
VYLTGVGTYQRYGRDIDDSNAESRGKGAMMLAEQWLSVIKSERERDIRKAQRAHLVDREKVDERVGGAQSADLGTSIGRIVRTPVQPGRTAADTSL